MVNEPLSKKDVLNDNCEITPSVASSDMHFDVLEKKDGMLKIYLLSYFLKSIKNLGLSEDCANYPIFDSDLSLVKKNDQLGEDNLDLLEYLRNPTNDCSYENDFDSDPLYDPPPLFDKCEDELCDSCNDLSHDLLDVGGGLCLLEDSSLEKGVSCLEIASTYSLCASFIEDTYGDDLESNSEYMHEDTLVEVNFRDTFFYPIFAYNTINYSIEGMYICDDGTFG